MNGSMHYKGDTVHARIHRIGKSESNRSLCFLKAKMFICMAQTGGIIINDAGFTAKKEEEESLLAEPDATGLFRLAERT